MEQVGTGGKRGRWREEIASLAFLLAACSLSASAQTVTGQAPYYRFFRGAKLDSVPQERFVTLDGKRPPLGDRGRAVEPHRGRGPFDGQGQERLRDPALRGALRDAAVRHSRATSR